MADPDKEVRQMIFLLCEKNMEINKKNDDMTSNDSRESNSAKLSTNCSPNYNQQEDKNSNQTPS